MRQVLNKLWTDDRGILEAIEFLLTATIIVLGLIVGLVALRNAVVVEFEALANAILALSQGFSFCGLSACCASTDGSQALFIPPIPFTTPVPVAPIPVVISVAACP